MRSNQVRLNNGMTIPIVGFGTYSAENDRKSTQQAIHMALKMGYRHFDTAKIYGSEAAVGNALREAINGGEIQRDDIFVTSKLWGSDHSDPVSALKHSLKTLGMEYLDLYLVHWPVSLKPWVSYPVPQEHDFEPFDLQAVWSGMEKCLELGLCKSIGVSNFSCTKLEQLLQISSVPPAVNQVEMHPMWRQGKLRELCGRYGIHVSAYSPLGGPGNSWGSTSVMENPIMQSIAFNHKATPAQVALRWGMSKGASVIVKSFNHKRIKENMGALDVTLDESDFVNIEKIEERKIMRGEFLTNETTSPYKTIQDLWNDEI